jgi:hypothetical protein
VSFVNVVINKWDVVIMKKIMFGVLQRWTPSRDIFICISWRKQKTEKCHKLHRQCQISHERRKKECLGKFKFSLNRLKLLCILFFNFCQWFKRKSYCHIIKRITNYFSNFAMNNLLVANLLHFCRNHERLWEIWHWQHNFVTPLSLLFPPRNTYENISTRCSPL